MSYLHIDLRVAQTPKKAGQPCGDLTDSLRTPEGTILVVADGIGSGIRANLSAHFCVSRLMEKLKRGATLRQAFGEVVQTLEVNRGTDMPWAAFSVARMLPDGNTTVLSYEMPSPALVVRRNAYVLPQQSLSSGHAVITQANCSLVPGDSLLLVSDGITQAGIGNGLAYGWTMDGACREASLRLASGGKLVDLPEQLERKAWELAGKHGDDTTVALATCREGIVVTLLTGPPINPDQDEELVQQFMDFEGQKVICGGTTAGIVAREIGVVAKVDARVLHHLVPPRYEIEGIELATEGAICLNQLYNLLDDPDVHFEQRSAVSDLYDMLLSADRVRLMAGTAPNPGNETMDFRQQGILARRQIVPLLAEKLRALGKLVEILWH